MLIFIGETMRICIFGCGRMGALTANIMCAEGHEVTVIDKNEDSFNRLTKDFNGTLIKGNGLEIAVLIKAGLDKQDAFIATTNYDTRNILGAVIAKNQFNVPKVVARFYDQERAKIFGSFGIEAVCVTSLGSESVQNIILGK